MTRTALVVSASLLVHGCSWTQVSPPRVTTLEAPQGPVEVVTRAARPTSSQIIWEAIAIELEPAPVCQQRVWGTEHAEIRERSDGRRRFGKAAPFLGVLGMVGGGVLLVTEVTSDDMSPVLVPLSVVTFVVGIGLAVMGKPLQRTTYRTRTEERPGRSYITKAECTDDVEYEWNEALMKTFRLDTPWGTTVTGGWSSRLANERTVMFSTKFHEAAILYDDDAQSKIRSGWTLHLGGDPVPLELSERQASQLLKTGRHVALEHGRFPPEKKPASPSPEACAPMRALARAVDEAVLQQADCEQLALALEMIRTSHIPTLLELQQWANSVDADTPAPCGIALDARVDATLTRCQSSLPKWPRLLQ